MEKGLKKYFEIIIDDVVDWSWKEYIVFVIESLYSTVFPFIAGMLLVKRNEPVWIFMLILPIYFKMKISRKFDTKKKKKKIYVK